MATGQDKWMGRMSMVIPCHGYPETNGIQIYINGLMSIIPIWVYNPTLAHIP